MSTQSLHSDAVKATVEVSEEAGGQDVRLPEGFRLPGGVVSVRRVKSGVLLEPVISGKRRTRDEIRAMWAEMDSCGADPLFPDGRDQGAAEIRLHIK